MMNTLNELLDRLKVEFGDKFDVWRYLNNNPYFCDLNEDVMRALVFDILRKQLKKLTNEDILFIKNTSYLASRFRRGDDRQVAAVVELLRDLGIKKILLAPLVVNRSYSLVAAMEAFTKGGYRIGWDTDEKRFLMTIE